MQFTSRHLVVAALWALWCTVHSFLIAPRVTDYLRNKLGDRFRFYRLFFNAVALATVLPLAFYSFYPKETPVFHWGGALVCIRYGLLALSVFLFLAGARHHRLSSILGLDQVRGGASRRALSTSSCFAITGIYGVIRHPWYVGGLLLIWARDLGWTALSINLVLSLYLVVGAFLEERKLVLQFGDDYRRYQEKVSMLFPWKWIKRKLNRLA